MAQKLTIKNPYVIGATVPNGKGIAVISKDSLGKTGKGVMAQIYKSGSGEWTPETDLQILLKFIPIYDITPRPYVVGEEQK